ncbi:MAG: hypothetical protein IJN52_07880 [Bacteroidales bacterium]|nr:hypothetical protein [Bacteroidales bacterium]
MIDSKEKKKGDSFSLESTIEWKDKLVLRTYDTQANKIVYLSQTSFESKKKHTLNDFKDPKVIVTAVSSDVEYEIKAPVYNLEYIHEGKEYRTELVKGMSLKDYPEALSLLGQKKSEDGKVEDILITDDFKGFIGALYDASVKAKGTLSLFPETFLTGENENQMRTDYMSLINDYIDETYYHIDYNFTDLELFLSLKL